MLETHRLLMRGFEESNFLNFAALLRDPRVMKHIGAKLFNEEESWRKYMSLRGAWNLLGFGYWDVFEKNSNEYVGYVGFCDFYRKTVPTIQGRPEIGWVVVYDQQGKGYATEAAKVAMNWGASKFGEVNTVCIMDPNYPATKRVAEKCGFVKMALADYNGESWLLMEHKRNGPDNLNKS